VEGLPLANDFGGLGCQLPPNPPIETKRHFPKLPTRASVVYFVLIGKFIKIGVTTNLTERLKTFQCVTVQDIEVLLTIPGDRDLEGRLHTLFEKIRLRLSPGIAVYLRSAALKPNPKSQSRRRSLCPRVLCSMTKFCLLRSGADEQRYSG
jgi:hypothetical protein